MAKRGRRAARTTKRQLFAAEVAAADALTRMVADVDGAALALVAIKAAPPQPGLADLLARSAKGAAGASSSGTAKRKRGGVENVMPLAAPAKPAGKRLRACRQAQNEQEAGEVAGVLEVKTRSGRTAQRFRFVGG